MTGRIVVVEDDPSVAELVTLYLRNADFIVALNTKDFPQQSLRANVIGPGDPLPGARATRRRGDPESLQTR